MVNKKNAVHLQPISRGISSSWLERDTGSVEVSGSSPLCSTFFRPVRLGRLFVFQYSSRNVQPTYQGSPEILSNTSPDPIVSQPTQPKTQRFQMLPAHIRQILNSGPKNIKNKYVFLLIITKGEVHLQRFLKRI